MYGNTRYVLCSKIEQVSVHTYLLKPVKVTKVCRFYQIKLKIEENCKSDIAVKIKLFKHKRA